MSKIEQESTIHAQVVRGIVKVVLLLNKPGRGPLTISQVVDEAFRDTSDEAQMFIWEFIKDGCRVSEGTLKAIRSGDYKDIWKMTNEFLSHFGYPSVQPPLITRE